MNVYIFIFFIFLYYFLNSYIVQEEATKKEKKLLKTDVFYNGVIIKKISLT